MDAIVAHATAKWSDHCTGAGNWQAGCLVLEAESSEWKKVNQ